nr:unnamed protein product [Callosobruchus chinensis]
MDLGKDVEINISVVPMIYKADKTPCFNFPYHQQITKLNFTKLNLAKDTHNERLFINEIKEAVPEYNLVSPDVSVEPANYTCGIGIYCEELDIRHKQNTQTAVTTDSLSALQAITKQGEDKDQDYITLSTRAEIIAASQQRDIKLIWVPSHTALFGLIKDKLWDQWTENYKNGHQNKGQHYADIQPNPQKIPWFYNIRFNNREMIIRMRTNHCCTPVHLNKIGMKTQTAAVESMAGAKGQQRTAQHQITMHDPNIESDDIHHAGTPQKQSQNLKHKNPRQTNHTEGRAK